MAKAEQADSSPLQDGLTIPGEITRRQERKAALEKRAPRSKPVRRRVTPLSWPSTNNQLSGQYKPDLGSGPFWWGVSQFLRINSRSEI